jgi:hypothetical protein
VSLSWPLTCSVRTSGLVNKFGGCTMVGFIELDPASPTRAGR